MLMEKTVQGALPAGEELRSARNICAKDPEMASMKYVGAETTNGREFRYYIDAEGKYRYNDDTDEDRRLDKISEENRRQWYKNKKMAKKQPLC